MATRIKNSLADTDRLITEEESANPGQSTPRLQ